MAYPRRLRFEAIREVAFGAIGAAYGAVGAAVATPARIITFNNTTDVDLYVSTDGVTDMLRIVSGSGKIFDVTTNKVRDDGFFLPENTIIYVRQTAMGAPASGVFFVEIAFGG